MDQSLISQDCHSQSPEKMSNSPARQASTAPSQDAPLNKKASASEERNCEGYKSSSNLSDRSFFSPWKWDPNAPDTSSSTEQTKPRMVIEKGSFISFDIHELIALIKSFQEVGNGSINSPESFQESIKNILKNE